MNRNATILIADDDDDDRYLLQSVLDDCNLLNPTVFVGDGLELLEYIRTDNNDASVGLIILDLNMPRMDGREVLKVLKTEPKLRKIPVVVLTTSKSEKDVNQCYALGANCYISKPSSFDVFNDTILTLVKFWINLTHLPIKPESFKAFY
ncbi:response regulator [Runella zeae]|uniref:response regulator n=1 Tax=Runella zeae TaxID=94255 RepID=UPI00048C00D0|nr:response regulator [Runella zeae]